MGLDIDIVMLIFQIQSNYLLELKQQSISHQLEKKGEAPTTN